jgi:hypothetical protein
MLARRDDYQAGFGQGSGFMRLPDLVLTEARPAIQADQPEHGATRQLE